MKIKLRGILSKFVVLAILLSNASCENSGTETGDPGFAVEFSSFESGQAQWLQLFLPKAFAEVREVKMCIHQMRFKADNDSEEPGENANIKVGYIELEPAGTDLGGVSVAAGDYRRVDIMVKDDCGEGFALSVTNDFGTYEISGPKILRFDGDFSVDGDSQVLILNIPNFINFFDSVTSNQDLEDGVEDVEGSF